MALLDIGGIEALRAVPSRGRPARLDESQLVGLRRANLLKPTENGFGAELWTLKRVEVVINRLYGVKFGQTQIWWILGALGFSVQKPEKRDIERNEEAVRSWKHSTWPALKKKAKREGRLFVIVDESIIQFHFNWNHVSVIAGLTHTNTNCLFRLHEGSIKKKEIVGFLKALKAHLKQPLLIIWDSLRAHRSRLVRECLDRFDGHIQIAFLSPYAPDISPVEYLWTWLKRHALVNYCSNDRSELHTTARNKLKSAQKRPSIIAACWIQAML
jgi:transposase